jgi:hypothetical protein
MSARRTRSREIRPHASLCASSLRAPPANFLVRPTRVCLHLPGACRGEACRVRSSGGSFPRFPFEALPGAFGRARLTSRPQTSSPQTSRPVAFQCPAAICASGFHFKFRAFFPVRALFAGPRLSGRPARLNRGSFSPVFALTFRASKPFRSRIHLRVPVPPAKDSACRGRNQVQASLGELARQGQGRANVAKVDVTGTRECREGGHVRDARPSRKRTLHGRAHIERPDAAGTRTHRET